MSLRETLSKHWYAFQQELFPRLEMESTKKSGAIAELVGDGIRGSIADGGEITR